MNRIKNICVTLTGCLLFTAPLAAGSNCQSSKSTCGSSTPARTVALASSRGGNDIVDTAARAGSFKTLIAAVQAAGLVDALRGDGPFTVFAPSDDAFAKLPKGTVEELVMPKNKGLLTAILTYHVVPGKVMASDVVTKTGATTLNGQRLDIRLDGGVKVDNANVTATDIECSNGVIHVIDRVIMPSTDNLIELATKAGSFETLAAAIKTAGLAGVLSGDGPFTVFAPTDAAFAKLPAGTVESLLEPANRHKLASILKYHVVSGRVFARDALNAETAKTVEGSRVSFRIRGGNLMVNDANIIDADIEASNGVIHIIDSVILPG